MINKEAFKEILVSNEGFILHEVKEIVPREGVFVPESLDKVIVFYGVRRSGKTFLLFDFMRKHPENSLYLDRELGGLVEACKRLGADVGILLVHDEDKERKRDGIKISVLPVWKWASLASA
jgi:hypothetical protein